MKNIWKIFRADWRRLTASVVAVVVLLGLCLVPCLYAWFNILSNWDPYGTASTSRISVAVASEDAGCEVLGLEVNIGALVLQGLESNDQMGWVFVDSRAEALDGVESGDYYAALIVPEEFTEDFVSILSGDLRHPQIQYYENEKKNAIAPKITSKAKTAVQEQINTTVIGKAAEALTTAGSVFKAMGLDSEALADGIMDKLTGARQEMAQLQKVLLSLKDVMNGADGLLTAASVTIADARGTVEDADAAAGSTVQLISTGLSAADTAYSDLLTVLNNTDKVLGDIEDALRSMDTSAADEALKADLHRKIQAAIAALEDQLAAAEDEAVKAQMETAIADLKALDALVDTLEPSALQGPVLDMLHQVRQELLAEGVAAPAQGKNPPDEAENRAASQMMAEPCVLKMLEGMKELLWRASAAEEKEQLQRSLDRMRVEQDLRRIAWEKDYDAAVQLIREMRACLESVRNSLDGEKRCDVEDCLAKAASFPNKHAGEA